MDVRSDATTGQRAAPSLQPDAGPADAPDEPEVRRRRISRFALVLAAIAVVALVGRVAYVLWLQNDPLQSDAIHYRLAALGVADGKGFVNPLVIGADGGRSQDATHPPLWIVVLALNTMAGFRSIVQDQILAALIGTATVVMTGLAGRAAFNARVGLVAAGLAAVYPNLWLYERELVSEPLAILSTATVLWLTFRFREAPNLVRAGALGVVVGLGALTRSELIFVSVLVVVPVILGRSQVSWARRAGWLAVAGGLCLATLSPWYVYNTTRFSQPVPLSVGLGGTLKTGNCNQTYSGERLGYYEFGCIMFAKDISTDPSVADGQYRALAFDYISANRARFPVVAAVRIARTFNLYAPFQQRDFESERGSTSWVLTAALWSFWALLPFAVWGLVVTRRRKVPLYPFLAYVVIVVMAVFATIGAVRYRAIAEVSLVILAAAGIDAVVRSLAARGAPPPSPPLRTEADAAALTGTAQG